MKGTPRYLVIGDIISWVTWWECNLHIRNWFYWFPQKWKMSSIFNVWRGGTWESFSHIPYIWAKVIFFWTFPFDMHLRKIVTLGQSFMWINQPIFIFFKEKPTLHIHWKVLLLKVIFKMKMLQYICPGVEIRIFFVASCFKVNAK